MRLYQYVGSKELLALVANSNRICVQGKADVIRWVQVVKPKHNAANTVTATFIVDADGFLWIADRHSEHVVCAQGQAVLAAGEITFDVTGNGVEVVELTNQSTGYCPEPESWPAVASALCQAGLGHKEGYSVAFVFRRCDNCGMNNIVKEGVFECGVCRAPLSRTWNYG